MLNRSPSPPESKPFIRGTPVWLDGTTQAVVTEHWIRNSKNVEVIKLDGSGHVVVAPDRLQLRDPLWNTPPDAPPAKNETEEMETRIGRLLDVDPHELTDRTWKGRRKLWGRIDMARQAECVLLSRWGPYGGLQYSNARERHNALCACLRWIVFEAERVAPPGVRVLEAEMLRLVERDSE